MHRHAGHVTAIDVDFSDMGADPHLEIEVSNVFDDHASAAERPSGPLKGDEESIPGGIDLASAIPLQAASDRHSEPTEQYAPGRIAQGVGSLSRSDQIDKQQGDDGAVGNKPVGDL
jgi:hypothetical protein